MNAQKKNSQKLRICSLLISSPQEGKMCRILFMQGGAFVELLRVEGNYFSKGALIEDKRKKIARGAKKKRGLKTEKKGPPDTGS